MVNASARLGQAPADRLIFPLDVGNLEQAEKLVGLLHREVGVFKVGLELFTAVGPRAIELVHAHGRRVFLDLKLHDIPATVQRAVEAAVRLRVAYLTVHAAAGAEALQAAARAAADSPLELLAVTVLTSMDEVALGTIGMPGPLPEAVLRLSRLAIASGLRGLVCSPAECVTLREQLGSDVLLVTPGVRPAGSLSHDQKRVATPEQAIAAGADLLVVGRPIRDAPHPTAAAASVVSEIARALS